MPSQTTSTTITALSIKLDFVYANFENVTLMFQQIYFLDKWLDLCIMKSKKR